MTTDLDKVVKYVKNTVFSELTNDIVDKTKLCILDIICSAAMGQFSKSNEIVKNTILDEFSLNNKLLLDKNMATIWFSDFKTYTPLAVFINSTASTALDIDDGFDPDMGHAGGMVIPAVLTACEANNFSTKKAIAAIVVGYDVALAASDFLLRYGEKRFPFNCGSGTHGAIGVTTALANLFDLDTNLISESLRISQAFMPFNNSYGGPDRTGHGSVERGAMTKESMNFGALSGYLSFILAKEGYTGVTSFMEYDNIGTKFISIINTHVGIKNAYIKFYASCRWSHFPIEAILKIRKKYKFKLDEINKIVIYSFWSATRLNNMNPISIESIQYSIPYCIALILKYGELNWPEIKLTFINNPEIKSIAEKIYIEADDRFNLKNQPGRGCEVKVILNNGNILGEIVTSIKGDINYQLSYKDIKLKFINNCKSFIKKEKIMNIAELVKNFENIKISDLTKLLRLNI
jgi:2-methylcitrate dehydratase PrpD